jgi:hypothetical protein
MYCTELANALAKFKVTCGVDGMVVVTLEVADTKAMALRPDPPMDSGARATFEGAKTPVGSAVWSVTVKVAAALAAGTVTEPPVVEPSAPSAMPVNGSVGVNPGPTARFTVTDEPAVVGAVVGVVGAGPDEEPPPPPQPEATASATAVKPAMTRARDGAKRAFTMTSSMSSERTYGRT